MMGKGYIKTEDIRKIRKFGSIYVFVFPQQAQAQLQRQPQTRQYVS